MSATSTEQAEQAKQARERRLAASARAKQSKRAITEEQAAVKAAQAAVPHDRSSVAAERDRQRYLTGEYVHRVTGARLRVLDTMAPDASRRALAPELDLDGPQLRYAVECVDHGTGPLFFGTLKEAERAVRQSATWCEGCAELLETRRKVRARNKSVARGEA
jgi:hypothetical protein